MYLHVGNGKNIRTKNIIGIFDTDNATVSPITRAFLRDSEKKGVLSSAIAEIPKSFVLLGKKNPKNRRKKDYKVYIAQLSSKSILGRTK